MRKKKKKEATIAKHFSRKGEGKGRKKNLLSKKIEMRMQRGKDLLHHSSPT